MFRVDFFSVAKTTLQTPMSGYCCLLIIKKTSASISSSPCISLHHSDLSDLSHHTYQPSYLYLKDLSDLNHQPSYISPSCLSTILPISHCVHQLSAIIIINIDHHSYKPSYHQPSYLLASMPIKHLAYQPSLLLSIIPRGESIL